MRKEVIVAIVLGFGLGLIITFGVWSANRSLKEKAGPTPTETIIPTPEDLSPTPSPVSFPLKIDQPENNSILANDKITLAGSTIAEAVIVIFSEDGEKILEADKDGHFKTELNLIAGANQITIKAFDKEGNETQLGLSLIYSTAKI